MDGSILSSLGAPIPTRVSLNPFGPCFTDSLASLIGAGVTIQFPDREDTHGTKPLVFSQKNHKIRIVAKNGA
jgi:hypothetical protein